MLAIRTAAFAILVTTICTLFVTGSSPARAQAASDVEGTLSVIWGDPRPGVKAGGTYFNLTTSDGTTHSLQIAPSDRNVAIQSFGKRVRVHGRITRDSSGASSIVVDQLQSAEPVVPQVQPQAVVKRRVLFLLLQYKSDTQTPHTVQFYSDLTNPLTPTASSHTPATINGFFKKTAWGKLQWIGDVGGKEGLNPTHWLILPGAKTDYAPCGWSSSCAAGHLTTLANDAMNLAVAAGINVSVYDNINLVLNNDLDCCAWGGGFTYSGNGQFYGATWEPPWGQEAGVYVHEMGHSLGIPHSGWVYFAYDSPWDTMSMIIGASSMTCGSYVSANAGGTRSLTCNEPGNGYITAHKDFVGWIPAANKVVINTVSSQTIKLEANALPLGTLPKMIKICLVGETCDGGNGSTAHFLTVEARFNNKPYEKGMPASGVLIHDVRMNRGPISGSCYFNSQNGWAMPVDATPGDFNSSTCTPEYGCTAGQNAALCNAEYKVGHKYHSAALGITVAVQSSTATTFTVKVTKTK